MILKRDTEWLSRFFSNLICDASGIYSTESHTKVHKAHNVQHNPVVNELGSVHIVHTID